MAHVDVIVHLKLIFNSLTRLTGCLQYRESATPLQPNILVRMGLSQRAASFKETGTVILEILHKAFELATTLLNSMTSSKEAKF